jgi:hypothetical protein
MGYTEFSDYWEPFANAQGPVGDYVKQLAPDRLQTEEEVRPSVRMVGLSPAIPLQFRCKFPCNSAAIPLLGGAGNFHAPTCKINDLAAAKFRC